MRPQYVTDPNLLAQLNAPIQDAYNPEQTTSPQSQTQYVTDPNLLAQLNAPIQSGFGQDLLTYGKAALTGLGQLGQTISREVTTPGLGGLAAGMNVINALPKSAQQQLQQRIQPLLNYNIPSAMGVPQTPSTRFVEGTFKESPAIIAALMTGGASAIPEASAGIATQGGIGAMLHPNHPVSAALTGAALQGAGEVAPAILGKTAQGFIQGSMNRLIPYAKNLFNEAQKGYDVLKGMGKTQLVDPVIPPLSDAFGKIYSPQEAAQYLQSVKGMQTPSSDVLQEAQQALEPNYSQAVLSKFDPKLLSTFQSLPGKGMSKIAFDNFLESPTAENAATLHRALGAARTGNNYDIDQIYTNMRDQLKDNIIMPGISKYGSDADVEKYGNADMHYRQYKQMFGNNSDMENLAQGNIDPSDMTANRYYNMLRNSKESGAFNVAQGEAPSLPMQEYNALQQKMLNPGLIQRAINKAAKPSAYIAGKTPLVKLGVLGYQGMQN